MINKLDNHLLNCNVDSVYSYRGHSTQELLSEQEAKINEVIDGLNDKTDLNGDHKGSWQGISKPVFSEPGIANVVEKNTEDIITVNNTVEEEINNRIQGDNAIIEMVNGNKVNVKKELVKKRNLLDEVRNSDNKLFAHRGLAGIFPENTSVACDLALHGEYYGIEIDIQQTLDGEYVLMHDETIDRTTTGTGKVSNLTLPQLKALRIDSSAGIMAYPDCEIPTLKEIFNLLRKTGKKALLEIKKFDNPFSYQGLYNLMVEYGVLEQCIVISFFKEDLMAMRAISGSICLGFNANLTNANIEWCYELGNCLISTPMGTITRDLCNTSHSYGVPVVGYPINTNEEYETYIDLGVDMVTTDLLIGGVV